MPATTQALREECYRIRHDVYCRELGFEAVREDGMETDAYDPHSVHCLLRAHASDRLIGCIRLILPTRRCRRRRFRSRRPAQVRSTATSSTPPGCRAKGSPRFPALL